MEQNERNEKKTFIEIIEELNATNGRLEKENAALKKNLEEKKLNLRTFHTDPTFYEQLEAHKKNMAMFYLKLRMKVFFGVVGFFALIILAGLTISSIIK